MVNKMTCPPPSVKKRSEIEADKPYCPDVPCRLRSRSGRVVFIGLLSPPLSATNVRVTNLRTPLKQSSGRGCSSDDVHNYGKQVLTTLTVQTPFG